MKKEKTKIDKLMSSILIIKVKVETTIGHNQTALLASHSILPMILYSTAAHSADDTRTWAPRPLPPPRPPPPPHLLPRPRAIVACTQAWAPPPLALAPPVSPAGTIYFFSG